MKRLNLLLLALLACIGSAWAVDVEVITLNNADKILKVVSRSTGDNIDVGTISGTTYKFTAPEGVYELSMYESDGETFIGAVDLPFEEGMKAMRLYTGNYRVQNKNADGSAWVEGEDYTLSINLTSQQKDQRTYRAGRNAQGQITVIYKIGDYMYGTATPSQKHLDEGYMEYSTQRSCNNSNTMDLTMPMGVTCNVTVPSDADLQVGKKSSHYVDFTLYEPIEQKVDGDSKTLSYRVLPNTTINFRAMRAGSLTRAGYFSSPKDTTTTADIVIPEEEFEAFDPKAYNQDVKANSGYETGDIFVNADERGRVALAVGDTFQAHAMRTWELTDTSTANYFIEPDFNYTVLGLDGKPLDGVLEITQKPGSAWADIKAIAPGTAIVLVNYDAIGLYYYGSSGTKTNFLGGEIWGATWPENTAAYVITVGQPESTVVPNMIVNEDYNTGTLKNAGKYVDAEHDVFYFLDSEEGFKYTFTPENVANVTIAYPEIGETAVAYNGFSSDGVTKNADGSWTVLLRHGRQIVKMTDAAGNATYQVIRGRMAHREIENVTRPGSHVYQPGDKVKIQYSGLFHPANKLAGIYNMSAYVTYNGIPNGTSLILSGNQYTFGSVPAAQAVTVDIPLDFDLENDPVIRLSDGVIQVNGYGDPIGNHRIIDPIQGRNANFAAIAHKTYFGAIPDVEFAVTPYKSFKINVVPSVEDVELTMSFAGTELTPDEFGLFEGTYGTYDITAKKDGYYCLHQSYTIEDDATGLQTFNVVMTETPEGAWDGKTLTRPQTENGSYYITTGAELAWLANQVNTSADPANSVLANDIELANYDWTPIGTNAMPYKSIFNGQGHTVSGLYINNTNQYQGLFGFVAGNGLITSLTLEGEVHAGNYSGTVAGQVSGNGVVDRCANYANITGTSYPGGVVGYLFTGSRMTNSYNAGTVTGSNNAAGLAGMIFSASIANCYNIGDVVCPTNAAALAGRFTVTTSTAENIFVNREYALTDGDHSVVTEEQFASGEIAHILGEAFGQTLGEDAYPVIGGSRVFKVAYRIVNDDDIMLLDDEAEGDDAEDEEPIEVLPHIYTNGLLPAEIDGEEAHWFADDQKETAIEKVDGDATLYLVLGAISDSVDSLSADDLRNARWYTLQGIEVEAPQAGAHGVFIRVVNGKSRKVVL